MIITYHGGQCVKVSQGDDAFIVDPHDKKSAFGGVRVGAGVVLISLHHTDFDSPQSVSGNPFIIDSAGEYEVGDIHVRGYGVPTIYAGEKHINTIYQVHFEGVNMIFMGALGSAEIDPKIFGEFGDVDILVLPIGGGDVLQVPAAAKLATKLEAHAIIPTHYDKASLAAFLKEMDTNVKPIDKFTTKKKELDGMEGEVIVLSE